MEDIKKSNFSVNFLLETIETKNKIIFSLTEIIQMMTSQQLKQDFNLNLIKAENKDQLLSKHELDPSYNFVEKNFEEHKLFKLLKRSDKDNLENFIWPTKFPFYLSLSQKDNKEVVMENNAAKSQEINYKDITRCHNSQPVLDNFDWATKEKFHHTESFKESDKTTLLQKTINKKPIKQPPLKDFTYSKPGNIIQNDLDTKLEIKDEQFSTLKAENKKTSVFQEQPTNPSKMVESAINNIQKQNQTKDIEEEKLSIKTKKSEFCQQTQEKTLEKQNLKSDILVQSMKTSISNQNQNQGIGKEQKNSFDFKKTDLSQQTEEQIISMLKHQPSKFNKMFHSEKSSVRKRKLINQTFHRFSPISKDSKKTAKDHKLESKKKIKSLQSGISNQNQEQEFKKEEIVVHRQIDEFQQDKTPKRQPLKSEKIAECVKNNIKDQSQTLDNKEQISSSESKDVSVLQKPSELANKTQLQNQTIKSLNNFEPVKSIQNQIEKVNTKKEHPDSLDKNISKIDRISQADILPKLNKSSTDENENANSLNQSRPNITCKQLLKTPEIIKGGYYLSTTSLPGIGPAVYNEREKSGFKTVAPRVTYSDSRYGRMTSEAVAERAAFPPKNTLNKQVLEPERKLGYTKSEIKDQSRRLERLDLYSFNDSRHTALPTFPKPRITYNYPKPSTCANPNYNSGNFRNASPIQTTSKVYGGGNYASTTSLPGIGPVYSERLRQAGYETVQCLADKYAELGNQTKFETWLHGVTNSNSRYRQMTSNAMNRFA